MNSIELFSGCGGLAMGLSRAGFDHKMMVEWNDDAVATVHHNRQRGIQHVKHWPLEKADVRTMDWHRHLGRLDLVAGGPPCQPFSIGGKHKGHGDSRDMWPEAIRAVCETCPRAFLFENVRGLARAAFADYLQWIMAHLRHPDMVRREGESHVQHTQRLEVSPAPPAYHVLVMQVNAADFGAAQKRHRVVVAGVRSDLEITLEPPQRSHSRERLLWDQWVGGQYWKKHGLKVPNDRAIPSVHLPLVKRLRTTKVAPTTKAWVTVRDAISGLGEPNEKNNHVLQEGARAYPGHIAQL